MGALGVERPSSNGSKASVTEYEQLLAKLDRLADAIEGLAASNIMLIEQIAGEVDEHETYAPRYLDGSITRQGTAS